MPDGQYWYEADRKILSLFWQQVRKLRGNLQEDKSIKDEEKNIKLDPQRKGRNNTKTMAGNVQNSTRIQHRI